MPSLWLLLVSAIPFPWLLLVSVTTHMRSRNNIYTVNRNLRSQSDNIDGTRQILKSCQSTHHRTLRHSCWNKLVMEEVRLTPGHPPISRKLLCDKIHFKTSITHPQPSSTFLSGTNLAPTDPKRS